MKLVTLTLAGAALAACHTVSAELALTDHQLDRITAGMEVTAFQQTASAVASATASGENAEALAQAGDNSASASSFAQSTAGSGGTGAAASATVIVPQQPLPRSARSAPLRPRPGLRPRPTPRHSNL